MGFSLPKGAVCSTAATAERLRRFLLAPEPRTAAGIAGEVSFSGEMMGNDGKNHRKWWFYGGFMGLMGSLLHCYGKWPRIVSFMMVLWDLPSGKAQHNYGESLFSMGKSTISTGPCSLAMLVVTRG